MIQFFADNPILTILLAGFAVSVLTLIWQSFMVVRQAEVIIIERLGKFYRILKPGIHFVVPFIDRPRVVTWTFFKIHEIRNTFIRYTRDLYVIDMRESVYDFPKQNVITRDNVTMEINALLYYQLFDAHMAIYAVANLPEAIEKLTHATLRNVIGSMDLDETLVSRDQINARLQVILDEATDKWGVKVNRVELQEINPPLDIKNAMEKQMRAERDRRAVILEAQGSKESAILRAQGQQESQVLAAQGAAQARLLGAQAEAQAILEVAKAETAALELMQKTLGSAQAVQYLVAHQYIKTLPHMMAGKDDKLVVVPYETAGMASAVGMMREMFK